MLPVLFSKIILLTAATRSKTELLPGYKRTSLQLADIMVTTAKLDCLLTCFLCFILTFEAQLIFCLCPQDQKRSLVYENLLHLYYHAATQEPERTSLSLVNQAHVFHSNSTSHSSSRPEESHAITFFQLSCLPSYERGIVIR